MSSGSLSEPISLSFKAHVGDEVGNLSYRKTARNFGPIMASAARTSIVQVSHIVAVGQIDPDNVVTPCIHTRRMVAVPAAGAPEPEARHERAGPAWSRRARRAGCKGHPGGVTRSRASGVSAGSTPTRRSSTGPASRCARHSVSSSPS